MEVIRNRVEESAIEVFNLEQLWPADAVAEVDLAQFLADGFILREKQFRQDVAAKDWSFVRDGHVALHCSTDAIVPAWAWMLIASIVEQMAQSVQVATAEETRKMVFSRRLSAFDWAQYEDRIVVVKGCGNRNVPASSYAEATVHLQKVARKIMYGEPCSSVPIWRRPKG